MGARDELEKFFGHFVFVFLKIWDFFSKCVLLSHPCLQSNHTRLLLLLAQACMVVCTYRHGSENKLFLVFGRGARPLSKCGSTHLGEAMHTCPGMYGKCHTWLGSSYTHLDPISGIFWSAFFVFWPQNSWHELGTYWRWFKGNLKRD